MEELPFFEDCKTEVILLTTLEYDNQIPIRMLEQMHRDGYSVVWRDDVEGIVRIER